MLSAAAYSYVGPVQEGTENCLPQLSLESRIVNRRREAFLEEIQPADTFGCITTLRDRGVELLKNVDRIRTIFKECHQASRIGCLLAGYRVVTGPHVRFLRAGKAMECL